MTWMHTQIELGWLATSMAARQDGFLPRHRSLKSEGTPIIDEWGYLIPDLYWRHGRGMGEPTLEVFYALDLLLSTCQMALHSEPIEFKRESETEFVGHLIKMRRRLIDQYEQSSIFLGSPKIPATYIRSDWLAALPSLIPLPFRLRLHRLEVDPALLLRTGYLMLLNEWRAHGLDRPETAEALAVFGLGALGLFPRWRCAVCFRLSSPGTTRCSMHSQAELLRLLDKKLHSRNAAAARLGKRVIEELGWGTDDYLNPVPTDYEAEKKTVAGILWGKNIGRFNYSIARLREELANGQYPRVKALLGERFTRLNDARALAALRAKLDANEWIVSSWFVRVYAAEQWLKAAATLSPGRKQSQVAPSTLELVRQARTLIDRGLSQKEIAVRLEIKAPYLSQLLKRFPSS